MNSDALCHSEIRARFLTRLNDFSLDVDVTIPGQGVTAIFGHSGSGKTTLLNCIAGLLTPDAGSLMVNGQVWQDQNLCLPTYKRPIGYVFQDASLFPHLDVRGNLKFAYKRAEINDRLHRFDDIVKLLEIGGLLDRRVQQLSGGEGQRVAIARALMINPELLLMDEPLSALDDERKNEILALLESLRGAFNLPILYVSHSITEVARLADHMIVLKEGNVVAQGELKNVLARLDFPIQLGEDQGVVLSAQVKEKDTQWQLVRVTFSGGELWIKDTGQEAGQSVRIRILARDISLALARHTDTSITNLVRVEVEEISDDIHKGVALVKIATVGQAGKKASRMIARLTLKSVAHLQLQPGSMVWAQIKSVALV